MARCGDNVAARLRALEAELSELMQVATKEVVGPEASLADFEEALVAIRAEVQAGVRALISREGALQSPVVGRPRQPGDSPGRRR